MKIFYVLYMQFKKTRANIGPMIRFGLCLFICSACLFTLFSVLRATMYARGAVGYIDVLLTQPQAPDRMMALLADNDVTPDALAFFAATDQASRITLSGTYNQTRDIYAEPLDLAKEYVNADVCWIDPLLLPIEYTARAFDYPVWINDVQVLVKGKRSAWVPSFIEEGTSAMNQSIAYGDHQGKTLRARDLSLEKEGCVITVPVSFFVRHDIPVAAITMIFSSNLYRDQMRRALQVLSPHALEMDQSGTDWRSYLFDQGETEGVFIIIGVVAAIICLLCLYDGWIRTYDGISACLYRQGYGQSTLYTATLAHTMLMMTAALALGQAIYGLILPTGELLQWMRPLEQIHIALIYAVLTLACCAMSQVALMRKFQKMGVGAA